MPCVKRLVGSEDDIIVMHMNERLEEKLRHLLREDVLDWAGERTVQRAEGYLDRVGEIFAFDDFIAAKVRGTEEYTTNVFMDMYGEWNSVCTCPVRMNCKHGVALALCAAKKLNDGTAFPENEEGASLRLDRDAIIAECKRAHEPPPPPPPPPPKVVHFKVEENPFGRFTAKGGRHAKDFSFCVVTPGKVFHWDFIVSTLIFSLAKGSLNYSEHGGDGFWWEEAPGVDPAMFTCSCGDAYCGGFEDQQCVFGDEAVLWRVCYNGTIVELEFDRIHYEYWALQMLFRMRGSARLRKDPWKSLVDKSDFACAVSALMETRPRCRAIWERIRESRTLDEEALVGLAQLPTDAVRECRIRDYFPNTFSTKDKLDLRQADVTDDEERNVRAKMCVVKMKRRGLFVYSNVVGRRWNPTEVVRGNEVAFVREPNNSYDARSIRVDDLTDGRMIGYLKRSDAHWLSDMMSRHGLVLKGHIEPLDRNGKMIPIRIDLAFRKTEDEGFDWGKDLDEKNRLYFEMLRAAVIGSGGFSASMIQAETERIASMLYEVKDCPEIAFLLAVLTSGAKELEHRLTEEEVARRRAYCENVSRAMACEQVGCMLDAKGFKVLPLRAMKAASELSGEDEKKKYERITTFNWVLPPLRERVVVQGFPPEATGFAVFHGRELCDVCLTGTPIGGLCLFDYIDCYDGESDLPTGLTEEDAFALVQKTLGGLPVHERYESGFEPMISHECGVGWGSYDLNEEGRLLALRIMMENARKNWAF